jgi:hypothetical protein
MKGNFLYVEIHTNELVKDCDFVKLTSKFSFLVMNHSGVIILYFIITKTKEFEIIITIVIYSIL